MDENGYPEECELAKISGWQVQQSDMQDFLDYLKSKWHYPDWGFKLTGKKVLKLELHTGGWSGNEEIMDALHKNWMFWMFYWVSSHRGGYYHFRIKLKNWRKVPCKKQSKS